MASRYVVAVDGGNSKTDVVVADLSGGVLARVSGPGTRSYLDGVDATERRRCDGAWWSRARGPTSN